MSASGTSELLVMVGDVEPFYSVFANTMPDMLSVRLSKEARWAARREWMVFMRVNVVEFLQRWPELKEELVGMLEEILAKGRGSSSYLADTAATLDVALRNR